MKKLKNAPISKQNYFYCLNLVAGKLPVIWIRSFVRLWLKIKTIKKSIPCYHLSPNIGSIVTENLSDRIKCAAL